ncbi:MAG: hypothetical protein IKH92_06310 [Clostridiales bacterium]|nr:hypothetical protein [Clostridiales bacterium]
MQSALMIISFICTSLMLLPKGPELLLILIPAFLLILAKSKSIKFSGSKQIEKKPAIRALSFSFILVVYFIINCLGRYSDLSPMIPMAGGLVLFLCSFPFTLTIASKESVLPSYTADTDSKSEALPLWIFSIAVGFLTIAILSQSSPLYPNNNWPDSSYFMTVGRASLRGTKVYSEIFDHKGPLLYLIHVIAAIISPDSFLGMYIIQSICCVFTHRLIVKTTALFTENDRSSYILSVPMIFLIYSTNAYFYGDSTEELMLPFVIAGIYIFFKAFRTEKDLSRKDMIVLGLGAAFAFWVKFTLCGFWIGAILFLIGWEIKKHDAKKLLKHAVWFAIPCVAVSIPVLIYFAANSNLGAMFQVYFYNNIFGYKNLAGEGVPFIAKLPYALILTMMRLDANHVLAALTASAIIYLIILKDKRFMGFYAVTFISTAFFVFFGDSQMFYYIFALTAFSLPGLIPWTILVRKALSHEKSKGLLTAVLSCSLIAFCTYSFAFSCSTLEILSKKSDLPMYIFAEHMDTSKNVSILNYDFPDMGFYLFSGSIPTEKYFCKSGLDPVLPECPEEREKAVIEGRVEYVITQNHVYYFDKYELIDFASLTEVDLNNEVGTDTYFLYKRKEAASS